MRESAEALDLILLPRTDRDQLKGSCCCIAAKVLMVSGDKVASHQALCFVNAGFKTGSSCRVPPVLEYHMLRRMGKENAMARMAQKG